MTQIHGQAKHPGGLYPNPYDSPERKPAAGLRGTEPDGLYKNPFQENGPEQPAEDGLYANPFEDGSNVY